MWSFESIFPLQNNGTNTIVFLLLMVGGCMGIGYGLFLCVMKCHYWMTAKTPEIHCFRNPTNQLILNQCPLLEKEKYYPTWYLFNGHLQTIALSLMTEKIGPKIPYKRELFDLQDGGVVSLDWAHPINSTLDDELPTLLVLHGLTGGSRELYIRSMASRMLEQGWRIVVMNARGCQDTPVRTPKTYCAAFTHDIREVVEYLRRDIVPNSLLIAAGYSLGSNILVKYLGEEGENVKLTAAVSIGNPFDLLEISRHLSRSLFHKYVYNFNFAENLKDFGKKIKASEIFKEHPDIDIEEVMKSKTVQEFDELFTRRIFGYDTIRSYYRDGSSDSYVAHVRIPLLVINAKDDPISVHSVIPFDDCLINPKVILCTPSSGGHLAFFHGSAFPPNMWISEVTEEYLMAILNLVEQNVIPIGIQTPDLNPPSPPTIPLAVSKQVNEPMVSVDQKTIAYVPLQEVGEPFNTIDENVELCTEEELEGEDEKPHENIGADSFDTAETNVLNSNLHSDNEENDCDDTKENGSLWDDSTTYVALATVALTAFSMLHGRKTRKNFFKW